MLNPNNYTEKDIGLLQDRISRLEEIIESYENKIASKRCDIENLEECIYQVMCREYPNTTTPIRSKFNARCVQPPSNKKSFTFQLHINPVLLAYLRLPPNTRLKRTDLTNHLYKYFKINGMLDGQYIHLSPKLKQLLQVEDGTAIKFFNIQKYISKCVSDKPYPTMFDIIGVMDMASEENEGNILLYYETIMVPIIYMYAEV